ncbi:MAG: SapC family protein [Halomonas sp.]
MTWIALSRSAHAEHDYRPRRGYHHAAGCMAVPALLAELPKLLPHYVLAFAEREGELMPVVVLGLAEGENLYLHPDGRWLASYVPSALRGHPFQLSSSAHGERTLAVESTQLAAAGEGEPLFAEDGELAEPVASTLAFLAQCADNRALTFKASRALAEAGVLRPWSLSVTVNEVPHTLGGLQRIDEPALNRLLADDYAALQGAPMTLAYAQLFSTHQSLQLARRAEFQAQLAARHEPPEDLGSLFGEDDDDLEFDFDR